MSNSPSLRSIAFVSASPIAVWKYRIPLIDRLHARGIEVTAISGEEDPELVRRRGSVDEWLRERGIRTQVLPYGRAYSTWKDLCFCYALYRSLRKGRFDAVHFFHVKPVTYGPLLARWANPGCRIYVGIEGAGWLTPRPGESRGINLLRSAAKWVCARSMKHVEAAWFANKEDPAAFGKLGLLPRGRVLAGPPIGVDSERYDPKRYLGPCRDALRHRLTAEDGDCVVLYVGRLHPEKGVHEFLEATSALATRSHSCRFVMVGESDPPHRFPETRRAVADSHRAGIVNWLGYLDDVAPIMAAADILVVPTYYPEGVPQVILEGAAMGLAIILTDNVGCRDYLAHLKRPEPIQTRAVTELVSRITALAEDPDTRRSMGLEARKVAQTEYSPQHHVDRIVEDLYGMSLLINRDATKSATTSDPREVRCPSSG